MIRIIVQHASLPNAISTKLMKLKDFKMVRLEDVIKILEYKQIPLNECDITIQSVRLPKGKERLNLTKENVSKKSCVITIKNDDNICLARSIVMAYANIKPERWNKTQLKNRFNASRRLQKSEALRLHEEACVEVNDYGNDLSDVNRFAEYLNVEINILDSEAFNSIVQMANKGRKDKIYLLKTRNHFDVIKSLTGFYNKPYYCHECKKSYTNKDKHKCPLKCSSCFKESKCSGNGINCPICNRTFLGKECYENHLKIPKVCDRVRKCNDCQRILTGQYINKHRCGYFECNNCNEYVNKERKCYMKKLTPKEHSEKYIFYDFEATQHTGIHKVNLSIAQDFNGKEWIHYSIEGFCKCFMNENF